MNKQYLVISRTEDELFICLVSKAELQKKLISEWKNHTILEYSAFNLQEFPTNSIFIFHGEMVIPKAKKTITEWEF